MRMNEALNDHLTEFNNAVIMEINKRNVTDLTSYYLDDIFEYVLLQLRHKHTLCDGSELDFMKVSK